MYVRYGKRIFDTLVAVAILILFWWLYALIALAIFLTDGSPIIYRQERIGKGCQPFYIYKFRTMVKNADKIGPTSTATDDPRITKIGKFLRKTSLDELPQLFNILKGEMSLIGYRPDVRRDTQDPDEKKYQLLPGITGYAQTHGRSVITGEDRTRWEEKYVDDVSFITDLKILVATVGVVLKCKGSN